MAEINLNAAVQGFIAAARARMREQPGLVDQPSNLLEAMIAAADREGGGIDDPETVVTVTFADRGERTLLTLHHTAFDTEVQARDHEGGWTGSLERLAAFVSRA